MSSPPGGTLPIKIKILNKKKKATGGGQHVTAPIPHGTLLNNSIDLISGGGLALTRQRSTAGCPIPPCTLPLSAETSGLSMENIVENRDRIKERQTLNFT